MPLPGNSSDTKAKNIFFLIAIFALAMFLRMEFVKDYTNTNVFPVLERSDSYSYLLWAKDIACQDIPGNKAFMKWPFYAYFLSFLLWLFKNNIALVYLFQYILGSLNCVLVYFIAKKIFDEKIGFISALLCCCYGLFIFYDSLLVYTSLSLFLNSLLFLYILKIKECPGKKTLFLTGIFLGICTITQPNIALFGVIAAFWALKNSHPQRRNPVYNFSFFLFGFFVVVGLVTLRNYLLEKNFVLIAGNTGFNFYSGNNPQATGTFFCPDNISRNQQDMFRDARVIAGIESGKMLNTQEVSGFWFGKAGDFILKHPFSYLKLLFRKTVFVLGPREFVHDIEYRLISGKISIFKALFLDLRLILPFALLGIFLARKKSGNAALLYIALISLSVSIALFFVTARYRIMIVPYLMIFAGLGIFNIRQILRERRFVLLGVILILSLFLSRYSAYLENTDAHTANRMRVFDSHFMRAMEYKNSSRFQDAIDEFNLAYDILPKNTEPLLEAAGVYYRLGDFNAAEEKLKKALEINPFSVDAYYNLGLIYNKEKRFSRAKDMLQRAVFFDPEDVQAHFELGIAYKLSGDAEDARREFSFVLERLSCWRKEERRIIERELAVLDK